MPTTTFIPSFSLSMKHCYDTVSPALLSTPIFLRTKAYISLENVLEDEVAFPLDGKYFDNFPVIHKDMLTDIADRQYPQPELADSLVELCQAEYEEKYLDCKAFPNLHPWGWYHK